MCLAVPGEIISTKGVSALERTGTIRFGSITKEANIALVPGATIGDYVLVHAGIAISIMRPEEAKRFFDLFEPMNSEHVHSDSHKPETCKPDVINNTKSSKKNEPSRGADR